MGETEKTTGKPRGGDETILVVEDGLAVRKAMKFILKKNGYQVLEAFDAREALEVFRRHEGPVHLLLTDVIMPGMSGPELVGQLEIRFPEMKVLYVSGHSDRDEVTQDVVSHGAAFLRKPFAMEKVREVLGKDEPSG